jgi:hypothetical protein
MELVERHDAHQGNAERRDECLRDLLRHSGWEITAEVVSTAYARFGIPRSTLFRLASRFLSTRRASSLMPQRRVTPEGAVRLGPSVSSPNRSIASGSRRKNRNSAL